MRLPFLGAIAFLILWTGGGHALAQQTIRIGVLQFGTVNWELDTIQRHGLDDSHGIALDIMPLAGNQATTVALQAGEVDVIASDWLWVSRQRAAGRPFAFAPFSSSVGAIMVPPDSDIRSLADLRGHTVAVAGGPLDKGWLLLRGLARRDHGFDLESENEVVFGAPPLLMQKALQGEVDAVLNYWHYSARLEANGFRRIIDSNEGAMALGAEGPISAVGYVFDETWADDHAEAMLGFLAASREAKEILATSDEEWEALREMTGAESDAVLAALRTRFREGIPARPIADEVRDAAHIYAILSDLGGERLVGPSPTLADGTFWIALDDGR